MMLFIKLTMKKMISRNAMSAIDDVGILAPVPAFLLKSKELPPAYSPKESAFSEIRFSRTIPASSSSS